MKKILLFFLVGFTTSIYSQDFPEVRDIASRRFPWLLPSLVLQKEIGLTQTDSFNIEQIGDKIHITATSPNAAAKGLGWYLKYYCCRSMSHLGDNLSEPQNRHQVTEPVSVSSPYRHRYALNYCTVSYSMAHYTWKEWERELDWMALNGVNLLLAPVGMEAVWKNTLQRLGYNKEEIQNFIAHPTFSAWWLMGNLEGWGGPVSDVLIEQQKELQQRILQRMKVLGIEPVMQGFYGIVPTNLKNKSSIQFIPQGKWAGGFERPDFLLPTDPVFSKIAQIYYQEMKKLYGSDFKYFGGDPFHEGGSKVGVDVSVASSIIQKEMMKAFPHSTWILQGWGENPSTELLKDLDKQHTLVIELFGENTNNWEARKGYERTPFVWCNVSNFGEKNGLYAKLQRFADEVYRASKSQYGALLQGVGIIPEGIYNNPIAYDWMLELGWTSEHKSVKSWISDYIAYRYGDVHQTMLKAWEIFLETVYRSHNKRQEGPSESLFCARPATNLTSVSTWGTHTRHYDMQLFEKGVKLFLSLEDKYADSETYQIDKIDLIRQVLSNRGKLVYEQMNQAIKKNDIRTFKSVSSHFLHLIKIQSEILSLNPYFRLDYWLAKCNHFGQNDAERLQAIRNTKMQYTIWGIDSNPTTNLHEYAHKEWSGLLENLYYSRWKLFVDYHLKSMQGIKHKAPDYFEMEKQWVNDPTIPSSRNISTRRYKQILKELAIGEVSFYD